MSERAERVEATIDETIADVERKIAGIGNGEGTPPSPEQVLLLLVEIDRLRGALQDTRLVLYRISRGEVDELTDHDEDGVAQGGFTRPLSREEMMRMAQDAIRTERHPPSRSKG